MNAPQLAMHAIQRCHQRCINDLQVALVSLFGDGRGCVKTSTTPARRQSRASKTAATAFSEGRESQTAP